MTAAWIDATVSCQACRHDTGLECSRTLDRTVDDHYCRGYSPRAAGPAKVRCADCRSIHYHGGPPESLSCDHALVVTMQSVTTAARCCALFSSRHNREEVQA